jgi:hypothetical protein
MSFYGMDLQPHITGLYQNPSESRIMDHFNVINLADNPYSFAPVTQRIEQVIQAHKRGTYKDLALTVVYGEEHETLMHKAAPIGGINARIRAYPHTQTGVYFEAAPNNYLQRSFFTPFVWNKKQWLKNEWTTHNGKRSLKANSNGYTYIGAPTTSQYLINYARTKTSIRPLFADAAKYWKNDANYLKYGICPQTDFYIDQDPEGKTLNKINTTSPVGMRIRNQKLYATYERGIAMTGLDHIYGNMQDRDLFKNSLEGIDDTHRQNGSLSRMQIITFPLRSGESISEYISYNALEAIKRKSDWCDYAQPNVVINGADEWFNQKVKEKIEEEKELLAYVLENSGEEFIPKFA